MRDLFMISLVGHEISEIEETILLHPNVGAVILFTQNYKNPEQLRELIATILLVRPDIFIAVDHEGGLVQRFKMHGFRTLPAARVYGEVYDIDINNGGTGAVGIEFARQSAKTMAEQLLDIGVDLSLAPVLDLHQQNCNVIGKLDRAFHADPTIVALLGEAFIIGMQQAGMPAVGKHFPGHGSVSIDSHIGMPVNVLSFEELKKTDYKPFATLIEKQVLQAVMPAHVTYTAIDPDNTAGFSKIWLQNMLREELGFTGMVFSDCLTMEGANIGNLRERAERALEAGCDMLIVCHQPPELLLELLNAVKFETTSASIYRLQKFKAQMRRFVPKQTNASALRFTNQS